MSETTLIDIAEHLSRQDAVLVRHGRILEGDGNGQMGVVRKLDGVAFRLGTIEKAQKKNSRLLWAILSAVIIAVAERAASNLHFSPVESPARGAFVGAK